MTTDSDQTETTRLSPDDAFGVLGNETRIQILQVLAEADDPLTFSALRDRVGMRDSGQFNYHLGQLEDCFVRKTDDGYRLRQAGRRITQAIIAETVTGNAVLEPTRLDAPCPYCGADIEVSYREETLLIRCTDCVGSFEGIESTSTAFETLPAGTLTLYSLPPGGLADRSPRQIVETALGNTYLEFLSMADDICPRCTGSVDRTTKVCPDHDADTGVCAHCGSRFGVHFLAHCRNCTHYKQGTIKHHLLGDPEIRAFFETRGIDTLTPSWEDMAVFYTYEEDVHSVDPFEALFTFTVGKDELTVTMDDDLSIVDVTIQQTA